MTDAPVPGLVLAGGLSRRMGGGDKCLRPFAGATILDRIVARLRPQVSSIAINANGDAARFARFGLPVLADTVEGFAGPLAGILAGMRWAAAAQIDTGVARAGIQVKGPGRTQAAQARLQSPHADATAVQINIECALNA